ncbi:pseudouridine synthase domain protein [[Clostridium] sordellii ATCC 9714]|nr:pseudouridine synthase domain protein [[Clostridium] sordellii ATCC 9714] [Paeniclostridium sordellii ATCC 9714]
MWAINHPVMNLRRKAMGKIVLKDVEIGQYRYLTQEEIDYLKTVK